MDDTTQRDDGGPAFPQQTPNFLPGMSLRDWFAGQALQGMVCGLHTSDEAMASALEAAEEAGDDLLVATGRGAYRFADAMLKARQS